MAFRYDDDGGGSDDEQWQTCGTMCTRTQIHYVIRCASRAVYIIVITRNIIAEYCMVCMRRVFAWNYLLINQTLLCQTVFEYIVFTYNTMIYKCTHTFSTRKREWDWGKGGSEWHFTKVINYCEYICTHTKHARTRTSRYHHCMALALVVRPKPTPHTRRQTPVYTTLSLSLSLFLAYTQQRS